MREINFARSAHSKYESISSSVCQLCVRVVSLVIRSLLSHLMSWCLVRGDVSSCGNIQPGSSCCSLSKIIADYNSGLLDDSVGKMEKKQLGRLR